MMGRQDRDQGSLFYEFNLDDMIPKDHMLRRINVFVTAVLGDLDERATAPPPTTSRRGPEEGER
jgi:hypothetical protein